MSRRDIKTKSTFEFTTKSYLQSRQLKMSTEQLSKQKPIAQECEDSDDDSSGSSGMAKFSNLKGKLVRYHFFIYQISLIMYY